MSDLTIKAIQTFFNNQTRSKPNQLDDMHILEMSYGKRNKRAIDAHRTNQDFKRTQLIQQPLLDHYENVDWYERDTTMDLAAYMKS